MVWKKSEKRMLIIYNRKVKKLMWHRQRLCKSGFIQGAPGVVRIRFMCHVYVHSLIMWRYFKYFISLQPLGVSSETLQNANLSQNPIPATLFSACSLHSSTVQQLTLSPPSLKFWYSQHLSTGISGESSTELLLLSLCSTFKGNCRGEYMMGFVPNAS